jgi:hypothetical protein
VTQAPIGRATAHLLDAFADLIDEALDRGRRTLVSATVEAEDIDPSAVAFASRLASDRWFCWEQPDRGGFALAGIGSAWEIASRGADRFDDVQAGCAEISRDRIASEPAGLPEGAGPVWVGGFAFDPDGGGSPHWSTLPPALAVMPELALSRSDAGCHLTLAAVVAPGGSADEHVARARSRVESLPEIVVPRKVHGYLGRHWSLGAQWSRRIKLLSAKLDEAPRITVEAI